jgi:hypothetical protein
MKGSSRAKNTWLGASSPDDFRKWASAILSVNCCGYLG